MKRIVAVTCGLLWSAAAAAQSTPLTPTPGPAPDAPGKMPNSADCIIDKVMICKAESGCAASDSLGEVKLPAKVTVDFKNRVVMTMHPSGFPSASPIGTFATLNNQVFLQGVDKGVGWMLQGSGADRSMTVAIASHHTVLTGFGTCEIDEDE